MAARCVRFLVFALALGAVVYGVVELVTGPTGEGLSPAVLSGVVIAASLVGGWLWRLAAMPFRRRPHAEGEER